MDKYLYPTIIEYVHQAKTYAIIAEYKDKICLPCRVGTYRYHLTLASIEREGVRHVSETNEIIGIEDEIQLSWSLKNNHIWLSPNRKIDISSYGVAFNRHRRGDDHIDHFKTSRRYNSLVLLPDNYMYTYEKPGWLKKVVESEKMNN